MTLGWLMLNLNVAILGFQLMLVSNWVERKISYGYLTIVSMHPSSWT